MVRLYIVLATFFVFLELNVLNAQPANESCQNAIMLGNLNNFCSAVRAGTTVGATDDAATTGSYTPPPCWGGGAVNDVWFKFIAIATDITITINGNQGSPSGGTLNRPQVALYGGTCGGTINEMVCGSPPGGQNIIQIYRGGLTIGQTYYIRVDGYGGNTGTFQYCINNYFPVPAPSGDCPSAVVLCDKSNFNVPAVSGAGSNASEMNSAACFDYDPFTGNVESSSTWYVFTFDNNGTFNFNITPTNANDDIDFALFRLPNGIGNCSGKVTVRCEAASCIGSTGIRSSSSDTDEPPGCDWPSDNYVSQVNVTAGQTYALAINNFTSTGNGFNISFGGTADFKGPEAIINDNDADDKICVGAPVTFTDASTPPSNGTLTNWNWNFGVDASIQTSTAANPPAITYSTPGPKTISLTVKSDRGCLVTAQKTITVLQPVANAGPDRILSCSTPSVVIGSPAVAGETYAWTPAAGLSNAAIAQPTANAAGTYTLTVSNGGCTSMDAVTVTQSASAVTANAGPDKNLSCTVFSAVLGTAAVAGNTYVWTPSAGLSNPNIAQPVVSAPGTYILKVTDAASGCSASDTVVVTQNIVKPLANAGSDKTLTCIVSNVTLGIAGTAGNTYRWTPPAGLSDPDTAQPVASSAGMYILNVTNNANGCTSGDTVNVLLDKTPPVANAGMDVNLNCNTPAATLGAPAVPGNTYLWTPAAGLNNPSAAQPTVNAVGTFVLKVTNSANGCIATDSVLVTKSASSPIAGAGPDKTITCTNPSYVIGIPATSGYNYSWTPSAGLSNPSIAQPTVISAGSFILTVTDPANGCSTKDTVVISRNVSKPAANAGVDKTITCLSPNVNIGSPSIAGNSYSWTPAAGLSNSTAAQPTASLSNTYVLLVTNTANGCTAGDTVNVLRNVTIPVADAGADKMLTCAVPTSTIGMPAVAGNTYAWTPAAGLSNSTAAQPAVTLPGRYTLTVRNAANGCFSIDSVLITQNINKPSANAGPDQQLTCAVTSVVLGTPTAGSHAYVWLPGSGLNNSSIARPQASTPNTYTLKVTDPLNGCISYDTVLISQDITPPVANAGSSKTLNCINATVTLGSPVMAGSIYSWAPAAGLNDASVAQPVASVKNIYTLKVTAISNGCVAYDTVDVFENYTVPIANAGRDSTLTCSINRIALGIPAVSGNRYAWSPSAGLSNSSAAQPFATLPGKYLLAVTNAVSGCSAKDSVLLAQDTVRPGANAGVDKTLTCYTPVASLGIISPPAYNYNWSPSAGLNDPAIAQPSSNAAGTYVLQVANPANGCFSFDTVIITEDNISPVADAGPDQKLTCTVNSVRLGSPPVAGLTYAWTPSTGLNNSATASPDATASSIYSVNVTNLSNGCSAVDSVMVSIDTIHPIADAGPDILLTCADTMVRLGTSSQPGNTYAWSPSTGINNATVAQPETTNPDVYTLTVVNNSNGCKSTDVVNVRQNISATAAVAGDDRTLTCAIRSITIGAPAMPGNTYAWTPAAGLSSATAAQPDANQPGRYMLAVKNLASGCVTTDVVEILQNTTPPPAYAGKDKFLTCATKTVMLGEAKSGVNLYTWEPAPGLSAFNISNPTASMPGIYILSVNNPANGCTASDTVRVAYDTVPPVADAGADQTLKCPPESLVLGSPANPDFMYQWLQAKGLSAVDAAQPLADSAGEFELIVTNAVNGCKSRPDTVTIFWRNCECEFFIPTAFSPNHDGVNDILAPFKYCDDYKNLKFSIYNRWGELIFYTNDIRQGWNGEYKNELQQLDSYLWTLEYFDAVNQKERFEKGAVVLLR
jgi:gliding motility-associated-like protein